MISRSRFLRNCNWKLQKTALLSTPTFLRAANNRRGFKSVMIPLFSGEQLGGVTSSYTHFGTWLHWTYCRHPFSFLNEKFILSPYRRKCRFRWKCQISTNFFGEELWAILDLLLYLCTYMYIDYATRFLVARFLAKFLNNLAFENNSSDYLLR